MKTKSTVLITGVMATVLVLAAAPLKASAADSVKLFASVGAATVLEGGKTESTGTQTVKVGEEQKLSSADLTGQKVEEETKKKEEDLSNLIIAVVNGYVNVRSIPDTEGEIVGKLYDKSAGCLLSESNGWYKITSGNVTGYVKSEYCVTGTEAIVLASEVGTRMAVVNTTTLMVRKEPGLEAPIIGMVPIEEELVADEELDGWIRVSIEEGEGYISSDYVNMRTDFVTAESKAEEEARLLKEAEARETARKAAAEAAAKKEAQAVKQKAEVAVPVISSEGGSQMGADVAQYACQFVGNPYVYGGTSLTEGADCSGFVMSVYSAFGVDLPHSSSSDRKQGYEVEGGISNAVPGDLVCYSGHVALYIGNGQIVHASTAKTGIKISDVGYRKILAVRRIF